MRVGQRWMTACAVSAVLAAVGVVSTGVSHAQAGQPAAAGKLRFDVSFIPQAHAGPITGRVFVMVTRTVNKCRSRACRSAAPARRSSDATSSASRPGSPPSIDDTDLGTPVDSIDDIPPGDYFVQAFVNVYSRVQARRRPRRSGCTTTSGKASTGTGRRATCTATSRRVHIDPKAKRVIRLVADQRHPARSRSRPTPRIVKRFKFQSPMLTKFWGRPIYLGATVLLPRDYDQRDDLAIRSLHPGSLLAGRAATAFDEKNEFSQGVAARRLSAHDRRHVPASDAVLRRLVRRELGQRRPLRRRDHAGADSGGREALPHHPRAVGAHALGRIDRRLGSARRCRSSTPTSSAARGPTAPTRSPSSDVEGINIYEDENAFYKDVRLAQGADGEQPRGERPAAP